METPNQKSINVLNSLIEIHNDRIEGYGHVSEETRELDLKNLFIQFAETSYKCRQELVAEVRKLGATPTERVRTTGKLHHAWINIKCALASKDCEATINSCEIGEDIVVKNYKDALKDNPLGSHLHSLILKQYVIIKADHDEIKIIRDELIKTLV